MSFKPRELSQEEVDALFPRKSSGIKVWFAISHEQFSIVVQEGFLAIDESLSEAFMHYFSMDQIHKIPFRTIFGSLLGKIDQFNFQLAPTLMFKIQDLENAIPTDKRIAIEEIVVVLRALISRGLTLQASSSDGRKELLLAYDPFSAQFTGSRVIISFLGPLVGSE